MVKSFKITDDILTPDDKIRIDYRGPNPFRVYGSIPRLMQIFFHGRGLNVFEDHFKWDITTDPRDFYFVIRFDDMKVDRLTKFNIITITIGRQPSDPNSPDGMFYMEIKGRIWTEYEFKGILDKIMGTPFIWLYHRLIYNNVRRRYIQMVREWVFKFADSVRKEFGIPSETPELTGASSRVQ